MRSNTITLGLTMGFALLGVSVGELRGEGGRIPILDKDTLWRFRVVRETPEIVMENGAIMHGHVQVTGGTTAQGWFRSTRDARQLPERFYNIHTNSAVVRLPDDTAADWFSPDYDDSAWARLRGPMLHQSADEGWKLVFMRAFFHVDDPDKAHDLRLALGFRGGAVVYVNGREIKRAHMPKGILDVHAAAEPYPLDNYFRSDGFLLTAHRVDPAADHPRLNSRLRKIESLSIPASALRKGPNVLAISIHRAPTLWQYYISRHPGAWSRHKDTEWGKTGLHSVQLTAGAEQGVRPNKGALEGRGFRIWNQSVMQPVFPADYPDPFSPLSPVTLSGTRNGLFAGQMVAGDEKPIRNLTVAVSDLKGPGTIPASAVTIRYGRPGGPGGSLDVLDDEPPSEIPVTKAHGGSIQPLWVTVDVPRDAPAGRYEGALTIQAEGVGPRTVPLRISVADWVLPEPKDFTGMLDMIQSPESVALAYNVELWSDAHMKLLDRTFRLLAEMGGKTLYVTAIRRTHLGNEHAMVRWVRDDEGELQPDFSVVEKYLDVAMKHMGRIPGVILYCWEPPESMGHAGGTGQAHRIHDKDILITMVDPDTGELSARKGPAWGTPESQVFWKRLTDGFQAVLQARGLENSLLFGLIGDHRPTKLAMDDIVNGVPNAKWAVHSHYYCDNWQGHPVGMTVALWGVGYSPADPSQGHTYGWSNPHWVVYYPREMSIGSTPVEYRTKMEKWMGARRGGSQAQQVGIGVRGLGRLGADFWPVVRDGRGRVRGTLAGAYPESAWGQLNLNFCVPRVLGQGQKGPVPTVRSESFREAIQELEARVFIEKALLDAEAEAKLGSDLIARCRMALDDRIRIALHADGEGQSWFIGSGWRERAQTIFSLAGETARALGRAPQPVLK